MTMEQNCTSENRLLSDCHEHVIDCYMHCTTHKTYEKEKSLELTRYQDSTKQAANAVLLIDYNVLWQNGL